MDFENKNINQENGAETPDSTPAAQPAPGQVYSAGNESIANSGPESQPQQSQPQPSQQPVPQPQLQQAPQTPAQPPQPAQTAQPQPASPPPPGGRFNFLKNKRNKLIAIVLLVVILLAGASAGAYFGYILPNKPENVLKASLKNLLEKDQISGKGHGEVTDKSGSTPIVMTIDYDLQADMTKNTFDTNLDMSYSGVKIPIELRMVDKSVYLKFGDLSSLSGLLSASLGAYGQGFAPIIKQISAKISGRWIEIDESLLKTASQDKCSTFIDGRRLSEDEINQLADIYQNNEFINIKSTSTDTLDGKKVDKYELAVDKDKAKSFGKELKDMDYIKNISKCLDEPSSSSDSESHPVTTEMTVWIDKSAKQFKKVQFNVKDDESSAKVDFTFNEKQVDIKKPEKTISATQLYSEILSLFTNELGTQSSSGTNNLLFN